MLFSDIIGLQETKQQLIEMVAQNRLSHALLFLGKEGNGALPLALAFAQYISLLPVQSSLQTRAASMFDEPAAKPSLPHTLSHAESFIQNQPGYVKASQLIHPDIHFSYPVFTRKSGEKPIATHFIKEWREFIKLMPYGNAYDWLQFINAENKQGNITAEECNDILRKLNLKSFESGYKILLMWMPEYLGKEGNKLLKLIEEPPPDTLFILVAENEELVLPTIISRCQLIKISSPETNEIEQALMQRAGATENTARQVAGLCEGNYREALLLLQHAEEDWQNTITDWLKFILRKMLPDQLKWIEETAKLGREKQKQLLRYFNHLIEQSIRLRIMGEANIHISEKELDFAQRLNKIASVSQQQALIEEFDRATYHIERNANGKMLFHALTIKMYHIIQHKNIILTD